MTISLIGDGIFLIAIAWESYSLWNAPAALSIVGIGMTIPTIAFLLIGGVVSDRRDRRLVMAWADGLRAVAVAVLAVLVLMGALRFWELVVLVAVYGVGTAFFMPAFEAILPELLPKSDLPAANALDQFVRPIAMRLIGPVVGGALVAAVDGARLCDRRRLVRGLSCGRAGDAAARGSERGGSDVQRCGPQGRPPLRSPAGLAVGHASLRGNLLPRVPWPRRGAPSLSGEERAACICGHAWACAGRRRCRGRWVGLHSWDTAAIRAGT